MACLLSKPWSIQTHTEGKKKKIYAFQIYSYSLVSCGVCLFVLDDFVNTNDLYNRIVQVDLKFPPKPIVSPSAKDLISQVFNYILMEVVVIEE